MTEPLALSEYIGFTEHEVSRLCNQYDIDFDEVKRWYDGYEFEDQPSVYNPNSVIKAIKYKRIINYWTKTETFESLKDYIGMDFDGLKDAIVSMLGGERVNVRINTFQNDITSFKSKNDVLTLLIHLGYLAYDVDKREVYIPNFEVAEAFEGAVSGTEWGVVGEALSDSERLINATFAEDEEAVADALEQIHSSVSSVLSYNNEASLSCAITIAYYTAKRYYSIVRELPAGGKAPSRSFGGKSEPPIESLRDGEAPGKGFADLAFLPRKGTDKPAMIIELKYDKDAETAIKQIHENRYDGDLKDYYGNLLLVGINYDKDAKGKDAKKHSCVIERV